MLKPDFKIASAIIHYDETSPHLHVVGVPIKYKSKNGMSKQVGKGDVFTRDSLRTIQDKMRTLCIASFNKEYGLNNILKKKEKGRNKDINVKDMTNYQAMKEELDRPDWENEENAERFAEAKDIAQTAVYNFYYDDAQVKSRSFLWIKNIFVPDGWQNAVPDYLTVTGQKGMVTSRITGVQADEYEDVMGKVLGTGGWAKEGKWNGFLILPVLSLALSVISQKLMSAAQGTGEKKEKNTFKQRIEKLKNLGAPAPAQEQANDKEKKPDQTQASMKMMQYMMPVITAVFAIMYSSAFALYMLVSSLTSTVFQLAFNLVFKIVDKKKAQNPVAKKAR